MVGLGLREEVGDGRCHEQLVGHAAQRRQLLGAAVGGAGRHQRLRVPAEDAGGIVEGAKPGEQGGKGLVGLHDGPAAWNVGGRPHRNHDCRGTRRWQGFMSTNPDNGPCFCRGTLTLAGLFVRSRNQADTGYTNNRKGLQRSAGLATSSYTIA